MFVTTIHKCSTLGEVTDGKKKGICDEEYICQENNQMNLQKSSQTKSERNKMLQMLHCF